MKRVLVLFLGGKRVGLVVLALTRTLSLMVLPSYDHITTVFGRRGCVVGGETPGSGVRLCVCVCL